MGNEPGRLTSKHLDTNHIFQNHTEINPKNTISLSNYSAVTSQKSLPSQFSRKSDSTKIYEIVNTMGFIQNYFDLSAFYKTNITLTQTSFLICNEDDMQSPKNSVFTRDTFGGSRLKNVWDKVSIINKELEFILDKNTNYNTKNTFVDKKLLIDLKLNKITEKTNVNLQPIAKKASQQSNQSDEHKSPQFQITPNSKSNEEFQTANFSGLQQFLMGKNKKESKINDDQIQKIPFQNISHNLTKSRSENRIDKPINLKISKTDSEFSDFNNLSYSKNQTIENPSKKIKETPKSPIKSALLIKQTEKDALNFKKNKEEVTYSNKNIKNDEKTQNLKRSLTPSNKSNIPKGNDSKKIQTNLNNSKIMKKNLQSQKEFSNTSNNSSEEEPLQIKICLDLKKFNKNERNNNNSKPEEKEFENNQFLKGVVKDIDKLTQKMLNTNNNISMQNISQISENNRKNMRKPPSEPHFLSNQYSESSDPEIGKNRRIVPNIRKK